MASLDVGNWILRGTRTVETAGTLVAVGLLRDSSGLLLDRLVELGSSGGDKPDILTNGCYPFAGSCNDPRELRSAPQAKGTKRQRRPSAAHCTNQTRLRYGWISMYNVQKLNSGKDPTDAVQVARSNRHKRKDNEKPKRVASEAQLPKDGRLSELAGPLSLCQCLLI